jgi:Skp family chaperone for outer membrane proteins
MSRKWWGLVPLVVSALVVGWSWGQGDAPPPAPAPLPIGVLNLPRIFEQHRGFQERLKQLKGELEEVQQQLVVRQAEIDSVQKKLQTLKPGSEPFEKQQLLLVRLQTEFRLATERHKQQMLERESALYGDTYQALSAVVTRYAKAHGLRLVLRSSDLTEGATDQQKTLAALNRIILYEEGLDITDAVLQELNAGTNQ